MPIDALQTMDIIEIMENFLSRKRPPLEIRHKVDLAYKIENQSIIIYEIRELWNNPGEYIDSPVAKTTFVKSNNHWKVFWRRASGTWDSYKPKPIVKALKDFIKVIEEDKHHCFWG